MKKLHRHTAILISVVAVAIISQTALAVGFLLAPASPAGNSPVAVALADFDGDFKLDAVVANNTAGTVSVLPGKGNSTFKAPVTFTVGANPVALVVADFDGNGKPDIAVVSQGSAGNPTVTVLLNTSTVGSFSFTSATYPLPSSSVPTAIASGNLGGINVPDLVVANGTAGGASFLLNNGTGIFGAATSVAAGSNSVAVTVANFKIGTRPDIAVADASGKVNILVNNGGTPPAFGPPIPIALPNGAVPSAIISGSLSTSGKPDLAVADSANNQVIVLLNTSTGSTPTFGAPATYAVELMPVALALGDVNNDGFLDIVAANKISRSVSVLLGSSNGTFTVKSHWAMGPDPAGVAVGDIGNIDGTNDGKLDIVTANMSGNSVSGLLGVSGPLAGNGIFYGPRNYPVGKNPVSIFTAGIASPTQQDIAVANHNSNNISLLFNTNTVAALNDYFMPAIPPTYPTDPGPRGILIGTFHPGGGADVITANDANDITVNSFKNLGTFGSAFTFNLPAGTIGPRGIGGAVFTGSGKPDIAVPDFTGDSSGNNVTVFLQGNSTNNQVILLPPVNFLAHTNPVAVATGDFNKDGFQDIAVANNGSNDVSILLGRGDGTFAAAQNFPVGSKPLAITVGDFNGDGKPDLAIANNGDNTVTVLLNTTPASSTILTFTAFGPYAVSPNPQEIRAIDVNHDGKLDLVVGSNDTNGLNVLLGNGDGTFNAAQMFVVGNSPTSVASGDFNVDSAPDVAFSNGRGNDVTVVLNEGGNTTALNVNPTAADVGQNFTFTATITPTVPQINVPSGTVTFTDNVLRLGTTTNLSPSANVTAGTPLATGIRPGVATYQTTSLVGGTQVISGSYSGDNIFNANTLSSVTIQVGAPVTCIVGSSPNPVHLGESVTYTATITSPVGTPSGTVTFTDNGPTLGTATLSGGVASLAHIYTTAGDIGAHNISFTYYGDATHQGCTAVNTYTETVIQAPTATSLSSSLNPSFRLQPVTFTATVTTNFGTLLAGTTTVTFYADGVALGAAVPLNGAGQAQTTTATLTAGSRFMTAQYNPGADLIHAGSTSPTLVQVVNLYPSTTALTSSVNPAIVPTNTTITFTATVSGSAGVAPAGSIQFFDFGNNIGTGTLSVMTASSSQATLTLNIPAQLAVGAHLITAVYGGDPNYSGSQSAEVGQVVQNSSQSATANTLVIIPFPLASFRIYAQPVTLTATLTSGAGTPTGSVTFYDGNVVLGTAALSSGAATLKVGPNSAPSLARGLHQIAAVYGGAPTFAPSVSAVLVLQRTPRPR